MKKLYLIIGLNLIIFNISSAQIFDWASWTTGATSATLSNGNCNMSVNVAGSLFQNTAPRFDDAGVTYSPTNGTGLALDHNWANLTTSTTVTMNFSASATNPSFNIFDINRNNPCAAFCTASWTDRVVITTSPAATINVTQAQPGEQTVTGNGTGTVTVVGNMVCNGVNGLVTINITGTVNSITVTYNSAPTVDRTSAAAPNLCSAVGGETNCRNNRVACTDPGRQFITIGNVNAPCCSASVNDPSDQTRCVGVATSAVTFTGSPGTTSFNWSNNNTGTGLAASGSGNIASFSPTGAGTSTITVTPSNGSCNGTPQVFTITANPNHAITAAANRTLCQSTAMSAINMTLGGGATGANISAGALPAGVSLSVSGTTATISGTPTASGTFNFTVTTSGNACTTASTSGTITVNPTHTLTAPTSRTLCQNTAMTDITMTLGGGATNASISAGALPAGVSLNVSGTTVTISGTPTSSGTFNYTVLTSGNACATASRNGSITVNPVQTITSGANRTVCQNTAISNITMTLGGGATGATISGLPTGVSFSVSGTTLTISGTPSVTGSFSYTATTTGNACATANAFGVIDVFNTGGTRTAPTGQQCSGTVLNFNSSPTGGNGVYTINWGADRDNNGSFELSGSGTNFSFTSVNAGIAAITNPVQLTVTSNGVNCTQTFTPTINPIPTVNDPADQTLCSGQQTSAINFSGNGVSGTTFNWSNSNSAIGLAANGTGNIAAFTASAGSATVTVTPTANTCNGSPQVFSFNIDACLLPVELMYFNAKKEAEGYHYLYWATATEQNCAYFELEYSTDAVEFSSISKVYSKAINGNSNEALYYDFYNSPDNAAVHYYRLKQSDLDGTFYYSDLIALSDKTLENSIALYPNPAKGAINLQIPNSLIGQNYEIYNIAGQFVSSGKLNSSFHVINLEAIPQGFYVLLINKGIYQSKFSVK
jgi:hypothetical protein